MMHPDIFSALISCPLCDSAGTDFQGAPCARCDGRGVIPRPIPTTTLALWAVAAAALLAIAFLLGSLTHPLLLCDGGLHATAHGVC